VSSALRALLSALLMTLSASSILSAKKVHACQLSFFFGLRAVLGGCKKHKAYFSALPSRLPVELLMKCSLVQA